MTFVSPVVKPVSQLQLAPGSAVTIPDVNWQEFESILQELGENRSARVAYSQGTLEIMVPLPEHEKPKDLISDTVKILLKRTGRRYEPFGSTTFKRENTAGVEPDACFYIKNYQRMISRRRLEPDDPPPIWQSRQMLPPKPLWMPTKRSPFQKYGFTIAAGLPSICLGMDTTSNLIVVLPFQMFC